jgi:hypothetical protein
MWGVSHGKTMILRTLVCIQKEGRQQSSSRRGLQTSMDDLMMMMMMMTMTIFYRGTSTKCTAPHEWPQTNTTMAIWTTMRLPMMETMTQTALTMNNSIDDDTNHGTPASHRWNQQMETADGQRQQQNQHQKYGVTMPTHLPEPKQTPYKSQDDKTSKQTKEGIPALLDGSNRWKHANDVPMRTADDDAMMARTDDPDAHGKNKDQEQQLT